MRAHTADGRYIREQKTICGKNYMEADFVWISEKQHKACTRSKKQFASTLAQQNRNAERSRRYFIQLLNTNFDRNGFHGVLTYEDEYLPQDDDAAWTDMRNYMKRVRRFCKAHGWPPGRWVLVTEHQEENALECKKEVRYHHHLVYQIDGLTGTERSALRDGLEDLWCTGRGADRVSLGTVNFDRLQPDRGSLEALGEYLTKYPKRTRRWHSSRGLKKPQYPKPADTKWSARKLHDACTMRVDDAAYWEHRFEGWQFLQAVPRWNDELAEWRMYIKMRRKVEQ